jgi:hypothetical protein
MPQFDDAQVEDRLAASKPVIREKLREFLLALSAAEPELRIRAGVANWRAIDVFKGSRHVVRVFAKKGLIKIDNLVPGSKPGDYGDDISLGEKGEWSYRVRRSSDIPDELMVCVSDVLAHMAARRTRPR